MKQLLLLITIIVSVLSQKKYTLTIYESTDCNHCKFAANQIRGIVKQYYWENILQVISIDCQKAINQCKTNLNKPLLTMKNKNNEKLGEIQGVRSKLFFRDWISQFVTKNPIQTQQILKVNQKYKRIIVKNPEQVSQFFKLSLESKKKKREDKLDIIKQAQKNMKEFQKDLKKIDKQLIKQNTKKQNKKQIFDTKQMDTQTESEKQTQIQQQSEQDDNQQQRNSKQQQNLQNFVQDFINLTIFRTDILGLVMIGVCICTLFICIKIKRTSSTHRSHRSVRIPIEQEEVFR